MASFTGRLLFLLLPLLLWDLTPALAAWQTLSGDAPVVVAHGGTSGLFPDQTLPSYQDALQLSVPGVVLSCDLQIAKSLNSRFVTSGTGICRNNLDLRNSTDVDFLLPDLNSTYVVNGVPKLGWYAIDIPYENLTSAGVGATQSNLARSEVYNTVFQILKPEDIPNSILPNKSTRWWLNSEYTTFTEENSIFNATLYLQKAIQQLRPGYVSVNEIRLLEAVQDAANASRTTKVFYKFLEGATRDPSTNQTYTSLLQNLTSIAALASGILVPKSYIWPVDQNNYLQSHTALVENAHRAKLEVYAYNFANDDFPASYNYTGDPIVEILSFIESYNFSVDGFFTDFPTTGSEAIACYATNSLNGSAESKQAIVRKQKVISHNGASFKYPASTTAAFEDAIQARVDYIDCTVQISSDNIPFCRPTVNLIDTTQVPQNYLQEYLTNIPALSGERPGVYTFALTWDVISTFPVIAYSPNQETPRDPNYNGKFPMVRLAEFLEIAKNSSVGALITIQNAAYLEDDQNLAIVDVVADVLSRSNLNSTDDVLLQSDESAALARLRTLNVTYPLMYLVAWRDLQSPVSLSADDFVEISKFATSVNLFDKLVLPLDSNFFLKAPPPTNLIKMARDQNLTIYYQYERNELSSFAFDLRVDPTLQLFTLAHYGIDGFITDNPATVVNYLDNQCLANGVTSSTVNFSIPLVVPGVSSSETPTVPSPSSAPAPDLVVPEPPLSGANASAPALAPTQPAAASHVSISLLLTAVMIGLQYISIL